MPKLVIPLTDLKLKTAKAGAKLIKLNRPGFEGGSNI